MIRWSTRYHRFHTTTLNFNILFICYNIHQGSFYSSSRYCPYFKYVRNCSFDPLPRPLKVLKTGGKVNSRG